MGNEESAPIHIDIPTKMHVNERDIEEFARKFMTIKLKRKPLTTPKTPSQILHKYAYFKVYYDPSVGEVHVYKHKGRDKYILKKTILGPHQENRTEEELELILTKAYTHNRYMQKCYGVLKHATALNELLCSYSSPTLDLFFEFHERTLQGQILKKKQSGKMFSSEELLRIFKSLVLAGCHLQQIGECHPELDTKNILKTSTGDYKLTNIYINDKFIDQYLGYHFMDRHIHKLMERREIDELHRYKIYLSDKLDFEIISPERKAFYMQLIQDYIEGRVDLNYMKHYRQKFYENQIRENVLSVGFVILSAGTLTPFEEFYSHDRMVFVELAHEKLAVFKKNYPQLFPLLHDRLLLFQNRTKIPMFDELVKELIVNSKEKRLNLEEDQKLLKKVPKLDTNTHNMNLPHSAAQATKKLEYFQENPVIMQQYQAQMLQMRHDGKTNIHLPGPQTDLNKHVFNSRLLTNEKTIRPRDYKGVELFDLNHQDQEKTNLKIEKIVSRPKPRNPLGYELSMDYGRPSEMNESAQNSLYRDMAATSGKIFSNVKQDNDPIKIGSFGSPIGYFSPEKSHLNKEDNESKFNQTPDHDRLKIAVDNYQLPHQNQYRMIDNNAQNYDHITENYIKAGQKRWEEDRGSNHY